MKCFECEEEIRRGAPFWQSIEGWEQKRTDGGTNAVALRQRTGLVMCNTCMTKRKAGIPAAQEKLV